MASFIFDVAVSVSHLLTGKLTGAEFWRRLVGKFGVLWRDASAP